MVGFTDIASALHYTVDNKTTTVTYHYRSSACPLKNIVTLKIDRDVEYV